jgi:hypothetical protein
MTDEAKALPCPLCGRSDLSVRVVAKTDGTQLADPSPARVEGVGVQDACRMLDQVRNNQAARVDGGEDVQLHIGRLAEIRDGLSEWGYGHAVEELDACIAMLESLSAQLAAAKEQVKCAVKGEELAWTAAKKAEDELAAIDAARKP